MNSPESARAWLRAHAKLYVNQTPFVFDALMQTRPAGRRRLATRRSVVVIEGFPRSGSTFSATAFKLANGPYCDVASHAHAPAAVRRAVRMRVPTVVLIRQPADAVLSYVVRESHVSVRWGLREYIAFYRSIWNLRAAYVVAPFSVVVRDFGEVIRSVNTRFGTTFALYQATPENVKATLAIVEESNRREMGGWLVETHVARPSAVRERLKSQVASALQEPGNRPLLHRANELFRRYVEYSSAAHSWPQTLLG